MSHTDMGIVGATTDSFILFENGVRRNRLVLPGLSNAADHASGLVNHKAEVSPTLLNRDGKTADQSCGFIEGPAVFMFEESGEPLNTFVVAVKSRYVIDLSVSR
jgi:hypothetical protein